MLPKHLVVEFWDDVKNNLEKVHGLDDQTAQSYIDAYCERMSRHGGFDMVYHANPSDVARGLSYGGVLKADPTPEQRQSDLLEHHPALADMLATEDDV